MKYSLSERQPCSTAVATAFSKSCFRVALVNNFAQSVRSCFRRQGESGLAHFADLFAPFRPRVFPSGVMAVTILSCCLRN